MPKAKHKSVASKSVRTHSYQTTDKKTKVTTVHEIRWEAGAGVNLEAWLGGGCPRVGHFRKFVTLAHQHEIKTAKLIAGLKEIMGDVQLAMKYIQTKHNVKQVLTDGQGKGKKARKKVDYS